MNIAIDIGESHKKYERIRKCCEIDMRNLYRELYNHLNEMAGSAERYKMLPYPKS